MGAFAVFDYFPSYFDMCRRFIEIFSLALVLFFFLLLLLWHIHECGDAILMSKDDAVTKSPCIKISLLVFILHTQTFCVYKMYGFKRENNQLFNKIIVPIVILGAIRRCWCVLLCVIVCRQQWNPYKNSRLLYTHCAYRYSFFLLLLLLFGLFYLNWFVR